MGACFLREFVRSIPSKTPLGLFMCESGFDVGLKFGLEFFDGDLVVVHTFEFLSKLNGFVEGLFFSSCGRLDFFGSGFDDLLELREFVFVCIEFHILLGLGEGSDELTACPAHFLKIEYIQIKPYYI